MFRRPPRSPLFPYTPLFRSQARLRATAARGTAGESLLVGDLAIDPAQRTVKYRNRNVELTLTEFDILRRLATSAGETVTRDRKSTRLNSSHQIISYAVFCLK